MKQPGERRIEGVDNPEPDLHGLMDTFSLLEIDKVQVTKVSSLREEYHLFALHAACRIS